RWRVAAESRGRSERVRKPCATVVLKGLSRRARSTSVWIHWWSPVSSAKSSMIFWVTSNSSLQGPNSAEIFLRSASTSSNRICSMPAPSAPPPRGADRRTPRPRAPAPRSAYNAPTGGAMTDFDLATVDRLLGTTRAVRRRLDPSRPVPRALVLDCLRLSQQAPTASNQQTWRWIVVDDAAKRRELGALYAQGIPAIRASEPTAV